MRRLSLDELRSESDAFDAAVEATPQIDHFCSCSDWVLPAADALMPAREAFIHQEGSSYWAFMRAQHPEGFYYLEPLEAMWALACPLLGPDSEELIDGLIRIGDMPESTWAILVLPGLHARHPLFAAVVMALAPRLGLGLGTPTVRLVVDLQDGTDGFLARRTSNFRRALRRARVRAQREGISYEDASGMEPEQLFARIMAVERRGWKGREGVGIAEGGMHDFYRLMLPRLARKSRLRVIFARREQVDLAYILGGIRGDSYRGLQFSYDAEVAELGLGNLLQFEQIARLCDEGLKTYDLGMHMDYKLRWADRERETVTLLVMRK